MSSGTGYRRPPPAPWRETAADGVNTGRGDLGAYSSGPPPEPRIEAPGSPGYMTTLHENPADEAATVERGVTLPDGPGDRFAGYAVLGLPFCGGDVLALRRFPETSAGVAYTSVWHRDAGGHWTFYADVPDGVSCAKYWGPALDRTVMAPIRLEWTDGRTLTVAVDGGRRVSWTVTCAASPVTRVLNRTRSLVPDRFWRRPWVVSLMGVAARIVLGTGRLRLQGITPTGHRFLSNPVALWRVVASRATVDGRDLGAPGPILPSRRSASS
ncbi:MAG: hypothetical protein R2708_27400 [Vicinamibacterales bacterium]